MTVPHHTSASPQRIAAAAAAFVLIACFIAVALYGLQRPVSFDGAMNLQVADSLADGEGYVRSYNGPRDFPREVQTNAPFVVPSAVVFELFGIGLVQSQIVNLLYMAGFLSLVVVFMGRMLGYVPGLLAAVACLLIPDFAHIGMNGWGEVVALFWWWLGSYLLLSPPVAGSVRHRRILGAVCLGMALATKTVLLIGVVATAGTYMLWRLVDRNQGHSSLRRMLRGMIPLLAIAAPLIIVETWRLSALGGSAYLAWWGDQLAAITWQTGVKATVNTEMSLWNKAAGHMQALIGQLGQPIGLVLPWLFIPVLGSFAAIRSPSRLREPTARIWLTVLLVATVYLIWWLVITPNSHARLRRIMIGLVAIQLLWVFLSAWAATKLAKRRGEGNRPLVVLTCYAPFLLVNLLFLWAFAGTMKANFSAEMRSFHEAVAFIEGLPADAPLFGKGFLSSPVASLYADREFLDIDRFPATELHAMGSGYLMADSSAVRAKRFRPELRRYPTDLVLDQAGQRVYLVDFTHYRDPFSDRARANAQESYVDFIEQGYKHTYGLHGGEKSGWRWATSDAEILLRYDGQQFVELEVFKPRKVYARPGPLSLHVSVDGCKIGTVQVADKGKRRLTLPITPDCAPAIGSVVRLGLMADNLMPLVPNNLRELSYVLLAAGFKGEEDQGAAPASLPPAM